MDARISLLTLGVEDLARSRAFYLALGFPLSSASNDTVAFFKTGGTVLGLYPREDLAKDAHVPAEGSGFPRFALAHNVASRDDVAPTLAEAERAGGKIIKQAQDVFWGGHCGYFQDPDGFLWEVAWNPFFPFRDDGSLELP